MVAARVNAKRGQRLRRHLNSVDQLTTVFRLQKDAKQAQCIACFLLPVCEGHYTPFAVVIRHGTTLRACPAIAIFDTNRHCVSSGSPTHKRPPWRLRAIRSYHQLSRLNNICNDKYWHHTPSAHCSCSHLCHHRHAHSWRVVLRQTRRNLTQIVARQRQRFADVAWPSLHALYGQRAPLGLRRACFAVQCGSEF